MRQSFNRESVRTLQLTANLGRWHRKRPVSTLRPLLVLNDVKKTRALCRKWGQEVGPWTLSLLNIVGKTPQNAERQGTHSTVPAIVSHLPHDCVTHDLLTPVCREPLYSAGWTKKKNAKNQVIFSVLRWKFGLPCDPPGSRIMKCGEIFIKYCDRYNKLILCYIIAE